MFKSFFQIQCMVMQSYLEWSEGEEKKQKCNTRTGSVERGHEADKQRQSDQKHLYSVQEIGKTS